MTSPSMPSRISDIPTVTLFTKNDKKTGNTVKYTGLKYTYIDICILDDKIEKAYTLREIDKTTKDLKKILQKGLLVALQIINGKPQSIFLPESKLYDPKFDAALSEIKKFVLIEVKDAWIDDQVAEVALLPEKIPKGTLTDNQYKKIGSMLLNAQNLHAGIAPKEYVYRKAQKN